MKPIISKCVQVVLGLALMPACAGTEEGAQVSEEAKERTGALTSADERALAFAWAPIHYQDVNKSGDHSASGRSDYITSFDYDGDFNGQNNWDNVPNAPLLGKMYFSVTESSSHFFIYYVAYHPRSWIAGTGDEHENDGEGCIMLIRKDGTQFGRLEAMLTMFHDVFRAYRGTPNVGVGTQPPSNAQSVFQDISFESWGLRSHPRTFQEQGGHGFVACTTASNCGLTGNDSLRYRPVDDSQPLQPPPFPIQDGVVLDAGYKLIPLSDLYSRRFDRPTFATPQVMAGNDSGGCGDGLSFCSDNNSTAIWAHGMSGVTASANNGTGEDPAGLFAAMFSFNNGLTPPTSDYLTNKLQHQKCEGSPTARPLKGSSDACVQQICARDPFCCNSAWDSTCAGEVTTVCQKACANCTVSICSTHPGPIGTGCDGRCAAAICAADSFCCSNAWDSTCVGQVASVCHLDCTNLAGGGWRAQSARASRTR